MLLIYLIRLLRYQSLMTRWWNLTTLWLLSIPILAYLHKLLLLLIILCIIISSQTLPTLSPHFAKGWSTTPISAINGCIDHLASGYFFVWLFHWLFSLIEFEMNDFFIIVVIYIYHYNKSSIIITNHSFTQLLFLYFIAFNLNEFVCCETYIAQLWW